MKLKAYINSDDKRTIDKSLSLVSSEISVYQMQPLSVSTPDFIINTSSFSPSANYYYCDTFDRFYFLEDYEYLSAERVVLHCRRDVLTSFASAIKGIPVVAVRSESTGLTDIVDSKYPVSQYFETTVRKFSTTPFDTSGNLHNYVLITAGGHSVI